jgi:hypothetical protein
VVVDRREPVNAPYFLPPGRIIAISCLIHVARSGLK